MSAENGTSYGRGRKPVVTAAGDPFRLVMSSFELPVGLREAAKDKAKRLSKSGGLPKMDSISAYLRGCLIEFLAAPEPVTKSQAWRAISKRLKTGTHEEIVRFLERQPNVDEPIVENTVQPETEDTATEETEEYVPAAQDLIDELRASEAKTDDFDDKKDTTSTNTSRYDFSGWLD